MQTLKSLKRLLYTAMILAGILVLMAPASSRAAGNSMGEPGGSCPAGDIYDYTYMAPPYRGTVTMEWEAGWVYVTGLVDAVGKSECSASLNSYPLIPMDLATFQDLHANDLNGFCIIDLVGQGAFNCLTQGYVEIVAVGSLKHTSDTTITANVMIMPVQIRY